MATQTKSVRMSVEMWEELGEMARASGKTRNSLIVEIVKRYCKKHRRDIDKGKKV